MTAAKTYVKRMRDSIDDTLIAVFPLNTIVELGTVGRVDDGRFVPRTALSDFGVVLDPIPAAVPADVSLNSNGAAKFGPTVRIPGPGGDDIASASLSFSGSDEVAASFAGVAEVRANLADFDRILWEQFVAKQLDPDDVVVWSVSTAVSGTVVISQEKGASLDVQAPLGQAIGLDALAAGVEFENKRGIAYEFSGGPVPVSVRLRRVTPEGRTGVGDVFGIDDLGGRSADVLVDDVLDS